LVGATSGSIATFILGYLGDKYQISVGNIDDE